MPKLQTNNIDLKGNFDKVAILLKPNYLRYRNSRKPGAPYYPLKIRKSPTKQNEFQTEKSENFF